ncbi:MAG: hypothetical protein ACLFT5_04060, partial [Desulfovermiculus sp.]
ALQHPRKKRKKNTRQIMPKIIAKFSNIFLSLPPSAPQLYDNAPSAPGKNCFIWPNALLGTKQKALTNTCNIHANIE